MKTLKIKDICDKGSSTLKQKDVEGENGKYPVFGASGYIGSIDTYHQESEYIAIVKDGSGIGRVTFMPAYSSVIATMQYILPKSGYNIKYISYCLQSLDLTKYKQGAAIPHIYFRDYGERQVNVEGFLSEQERIVSLLDAEFAKIDAIKANAEKQLKEAKDLFQSALKDYLTPKEGWEEKMLKDVVDKLSDGSHNPPKSTECGIYKMISSRNIFDDDINDFEKVRYLSQKDFEIENKRTSAKENDVLLTIVGTIGRSAVIHNTNLPITMQRSVAIMTPKYFINSRFLMYFFISIRTVLEGKAQGAAQKGIYLNQLKKIIINYPNIEEQNEIVNKLDCFSSIILTLQSNFEATVTLCNDLKQSILKDIFG